MTRPLYLRDSLREVERHVVHLRVVIIGWEGTVGQA